MDMSSLPPEVLTHILCLLDARDLFRALRVCKLWNSLGRSDQVVLTKCWEAGYLPVGRGIDYLKSPYRSSQPSPLLHPSDDPNNGSISQERGSGSDGDSFSQYRLQGRAAKDHASALTLLASSTLLDSVKGVQSASELPHVGDGVKEIHGVIRSYNAGDSELASDIWRHKIDPIDGLLIVTTNLEGGLSVIDLETGNRLCHQATARPYAHLEYSEGWVVHDSEGQEHFQLWRFERTLENFVSPRKGWLVEAGLLRCPYPVRAFRLIWPYLAVGCAGKIVIFDVCARQIVEEIDTQEEFGEPRQPKYDVCYIEFDDDYVFLLGSAEEAEEQSPASTQSWLFVYRRGNRKLAWKFSNGFDWLHQSNDEAESFRNRFSWRMLGRPLNVDSEQPILSVTHVWPVKNTVDLHARPWTAVHPDTRTGILCIGSSNAKFLLKDYKRLLQGDGRLDLLDGVALQYKDSETSYMAVSDGVMAFVPSGPYHLCWISLLDMFKPGDEPPSVSSTSLVPGRGIWSELSGITFRQSSCIQLDSTRLSAVAMNAWVQAYNEFHATYHVVVIDFQSLVDERLGRHSRRQVRSELRRVGLKDFDRENMSEYDGLSQSVPDYVMDPAGRWSEVGSDGMVHEEDTLPAAGRGYTEESLSGEEGNDP